MIATRSMPGAISLSMLSDFPTIEYSRKEKPRRGIQVNAHLS
jgi:hypothetical protein